MVDDDQPADALSRFEAVYQAHYGAVAAYVRRRTIDPGDAQDAVAETFTIAWRRMQEVPDADGALPWLYGVARRVLANQRRGNRRRDDLSTRMRGQQPASVDVESDVIASAERRAVVAALARLRDPDQEILRLAVWEERPHREIAQVVGCSEASVAVRLHRARTRLGREIGKEDRRVGQEDPEGSRRRAEGLGQ
ncbi:MAG: RNA polymerase sigma factor [Acidimicrobiales bacterium]